MDSWIRRFLFLTVAWILFVLWATSGRKKETFTDGAPWKDADLSLVNKGKSPWLHYPIHHSTISDPVIKYKDAYYYEMSNHEYEIALKETFSMKQCNALASALNENEWTEEIQPSLITDTTWIGVYDEWLAKFTKDLVKSPFMQLPSSSEIQVVHDRWMSARKHRTNPALLRMDVEVILYRFGKQHGKHVSLSVLANKKDDAVFSTADVWSYTIVAIEVLGVVPEDQIALHPVIANNPFDPAEMTYNTEDPSSFANTIIPPGEEVLQEIQRRASVNVAIAETQKKVGNRL